MRGFSIMWPMGALDGWRFCPRCGGALESEEDHLRLPVLRRALLGQRAPGVQAILERDGRVLLARRGLEPRRDFWDLPGGFLQETEGAASLRRELREETGLEIEPAELMRIDIEPYGDRLCSPSPLVPRRRVSRVAADDVAELRWFAPSSCPEMAFPGQNRVLAAWAATSNSSDASWA